MECNKEEAIRVRDMAERKLKEGHLVGAKKFILKALKLYPAVDGAIQFSAVLDVHIAAQVKVGINEPEPDYYGILQVEPLSDASTIKKQYRSLSLLVHPDKNKESMKEEAEDAFKLIGKAFDVLSNKRSQHDSKRGEQPTAEESPRPSYSTHQPQQQDEKRGGTPRANPPPQPRKPSYSTHQPQQEEERRGGTPRANPPSPPPPPPEPRKQEPPKATYSPNQPRNEAAAQPTPAPGAQASQAPYNTFWTPTSPATGTQAFQAPYNKFWTPTSPTTGTQAYQAPYIFWTACPFCRVQYQCLGTFLNYQVVCQNCHSLFPANDISVHPANWASTFVWPPGRGGNNSNPIPAESWVNMLMNKNHLAPPYGASTNGTSWNDLLSFLSGVNPYGGYGNNPPPALLWLNILLSAMNLKL